MIEKLKNILVRHEGLRLKPYKDTVGKLTIGVGRNLDDVGISEDEAMYMLDNDVDRVLVECRREWPWFDGLNETRRIVLASMVFNMGLPRVRGFKKALAAMEAGDWKAAADEMLDSRWAVQVGRRATELAQMMCRGDCSI